MLVLLRIICLGMSILVPVAGMANESAQSLLEGESLDQWHGRVPADPRAPQEPEPLSDDALREQWQLSDEVLSGSAGPIALTSNAQFGDVELTLELDCSDTSATLLLRQTPALRLGSMPTEPQPGPPLPHVSAAGDGGFQRVTVTSVGQWIQVTAGDQVIVPRTRLLNHWDASLPPVAKGHLQLTVAQGQLRLKSITARSLSAEEATQWLKQDAPQFTPLFNGKDFTGWAGPTENYSVEGGTLVCLPGKGGTIYTEKEYGDFEVRLEFQLPPGGNNGLAIRYPGSGDTAYVGMCELQVLDNTAEKYAQLDPRQFHGSAYAMAAAHRGYLRAVGQWNYQVVTVKGSTIRVELNGTEILQADLSQITEFMGDRPHPGKDRTAGHFGFAGHSDPVRFRNIEIREL